MSTSTLDPRTPDASSGPRETTPSERTGPAPAAVRKLRMPAIFSALAVIALLVCALNAVDQTVVFRLASRGDLFRLADLRLPAVATGWILAVLLLVLAGLSYRYGLLGRAVPAWLSTVFWLGFVLALLVWAVSHADSQSLALPGLLAGSLTLSVPLIFGSLSGLMCERSGVTNIAIEGQLLSGAFAAAVVGTLAHNAWAGVLAAMLGSVVVAFLLAVFSIKYLVNQVIVGVVVNVLVSGLTGFLYSTVLTQHSSDLNAPAQLGEYSVPVLSRIPVVGPVLFQQSVLVYLMYAVVLVVAFALARTRWGLRTRAVGEHPQAADTLGVKVNRLRFVNVLLGGAVAGLGGAFFTLVSVSSFSKDMTAGQGYIALAALIFGRWRPVGAMFAALLFGFATNLQSVLSLLGTSVPSQFLAMLPYLVTVLAVTGLVGASRGPAANGQPYVKE